MSFREEGLSRKFVKYLGFSPLNRGNQGLSPSHAHEVAHSSLNGILANRYRCVDVVRVPADQLEAWRLINKNKCDNDALMPKYSSDMCFACLTKTHFTHGVKLSEDGNRSLFNKGTIPIQFNPAGVEAKKIREDGLIVCVYSEELWKDKDAMIALMNVDNGDADVQMKEDELQFQGRLDAKIRDLEAQIPPKNLEGKDPVKVLAAMKAIGLRTFTSEQAAAYITFRLAQSEQTGDMFYILPAAKQYWVLI